MEGLLCIYSEPFVVRQIFMMAYRADAMQHAEVLLVWPEQKCGLLMLASLSSYQTSLCPHVWGSMSVTGFSGSPKVWGLDLVVSSYFSSLKCLLSVTLFCELGEMPDGFCLVIGDKWIITSGCCRLHWPHYSLLNHFLKNPSQSSCFLKDLTLWVLADHRRYDI